jgi:hypothetical protein
LRSNPSAQNEKSKNGWLSWLFYFCNIYFFLSLTFSFERVNYAVFVFGIGLILFALEYKKTPTSAIAVPVAEKEMKNLGPVFGYENSSSE